MQQECSWTVGLSSTLSWKAVFQAAVMASGMLYGTITVVMKKCKQALVALRNKVAQRKRSWTLLKETLKSWNVEEIGKWRGKLEEVCWREKPQIQTEAEFLENLTASFLVSCNCSNSSGLSGYAKSSAPLNLTTNTKAAVCQQPNLAEIGGTIWQKIMYVK